jgi:EAL domain-containing protein (putative c-di-GMP-specific phosphodiesterase class I)
MHMKVTAEGVETVSQRDILVQMGCNQVQGFLLSRPVFGEDLNRNLTEMPTRTALRQ